MGGKPKLDLNVEAAWAQGATGKNVTTAIMDDGKEKSVRNYIFFPCSDFTRHIVRLRPWWADFVFQVLIICIRIWNSITYVPLLHPGLTMHISANRGFSSEILAVNLYRMIALTFSICSCFASTECPCQLRFQQQRSFPISPLHWWLVQQVKTTFII